MLQSAGNCSQYTVPRLAKRYVHTKTVTGTYTIMATTSAVREKKVSFITAKAEAKMFVWTPDPAKHTVDNVVPEELLPGYVLTH